MMKMDEVYVGKSKCSCKELKLKLLEFNIKTVK